METVTAPGLAPDESQATYDTVLNDQPAIIKYFRIENSRAASDLLSSLETAQQLNHPNLIRILQSGETEVGEQAVAYCIMEKADDNLASVLRHRPLDTNEMRELLDGLLPALEFLHSKGLVHSRVRPANVLACGNTVKLSSDRIRSVAFPRSVVEPPGLYDAPETGAGQFSPASDVYSVAVLILESLTGAPLESGIPQLPSPFREIVTGGMQRNPKARWTLHRIRETLHPEAARVTPFGSAAVYPEREERPKYRKLAVVAVGGALVAGSVAALLVRSAHQAPQPPATPAPMVRAVAHVARPVEKMAPVEPVLANAPINNAAINNAAINNAQAIDTGSGHWAIVGAAYRRQADAERRARAIQKAHRHLRAEVYPSSPGARRYLVVFGLRLSEADARKEVRRVKTEGAPRGVYMTKLIQ